MSGLGSPRRQGFLEAVHLYRKVPKDLTDATASGGALSLACAALMLYLFVSNIAAYMKMNTTTDVVLDDTGDVHMRIFFNITMERLPCQFTSVDLHDVMGTSLTNITGEIVKYRVAPDAGLRQEFYVEKPRAVQNEKLDDAEVAELESMPDSVPLLTDKIFDDFVTGHDVTLVAFGAPWCPWSQRLEPVWRKAYEELKNQPYANQVRMARVDCTAPGAQELCQRQHIHAFPTIRVFRHKLMHSHENYLGDRTSKAFLEFMAESLPHKREHWSKEHGAKENALKSKEVAGQAVEAHTLDGEGCQLTGFVRISRVPGQLRVSASSPSHSVNLRVMNVSHHVDRMEFLSTSETPRLRNVVGLEQRSGLLSSSYKMHGELATLKHYLKVVPFRYAFLDGEQQHTYLYKANYNEYHPRKLEWYEGIADAYVDTDLVPNAAFHYDISPVMVVMREETQSFSSFVTKICAVIGGIYTVVGLLDNVLYHTTESLKKVA